MSEPRFCVFCGKAPESKSREHVLPQWLLTLTGDPRRVVKLGYNFKTKKEVAFAWQSLVVPACEKCNGEYATLEAQVKPIVETILRREAIPSSAYLVLLDWLDKVRVGLWLTYHLIQGNPTKISPTFYINQRIRTKDRLVAIYPLSRQPNGLNAYGVETPLFHRTPSAFGLRVNDVLILNVSADYLVAGRCGLPAPTKMEIAIDGPNAGLLECSDYALTRRIEQPVFDYQIRRPSVYILQPITPVGNDGGLPILVSGERISADPYVSQFIVGENIAGVGKLVEQLPEGARRIDNVSELIEFQEIKGADCARAGDLVAQIYEIQVWLQGRVHATAEDKELLARWAEAEAVLKYFNGMYADHYRQLEGHS